MDGARLKELLNRAAESEKLQEVRIRAEKPVLFMADGKEAPLCDGDVPVMGTARLIRELLEQFTSHSLYAYEEEIRQGFLTIEGGHRVGIAGKAVADGKEIRTIRNISGLNIRLAHEKKGCGDPVLPWLYAQGEFLNTLLISAPGGGKTTLLRDLIRQVSDHGLAVSVVDERSEIGACCQGIPQHDLGIRTDVMDCCPKAAGMMMMIRSMSPEVVAVDEIGAQEDLEALRYVMNCGCRILATVHGTSADDLKRKPVLKEMLSGRLFERYVVLKKAPKPGTVAGIYDGGLKPVYLPGNSGAARKSGVSENPGAAGFPTERMEPR